MSRGLDGLRILVPETRELDLFTAMLEAEGAETVRCPLVRILDAADDGSVQAWIDKLISGDFQDVVFLTGEGLRRLLAVADHAGRREAFVAALTHVRTITRGPKPARALREIGQAPGLAAGVPTSQGVLDALAGEDLKGRKIGVQLYPGEAGLALPAALSARGAEVFPVTPYRFAAESDTGAVADAIMQMADGRIQMVAFTSSPQVERLVEVARGAGIERELEAAFAKIAVAAIGPVVEESLHRCGVAQVLRPDSSFHLKPFVRTIVAAWSRR